MYTAKQIETLTRALKMHQAARKIENKYSPARTYDKNPVLADKMLEKADGLNDRAYKMMRRVTLQVLEDAI